MDPVLRNLSDGLRGILRKRQVEGEVDEELRDYLENAVREKMRGGMDAELAQREARMEMGGMENVKEKVREVSWETWIESLWRDVTFAARLDETHLRVRIRGRNHSLLGRRLAVGVNDDPLAAARTLGAEVV